MGVIAASRTTAPATDFYYETVIMAQNESGNNGTRVRHRLYCYNRGSTGSYSNYAGNHRAFFGGGLVLEHPASPFMPSGVPTNGLRWLHEVDVTYTHDSRGNKANVDMYMDAYYTTWAGVSASGSLAFPRIPKAPLGPTSPALSNATQTTLRYDATPNADDGGSAATSRNVQYSTSPTFASGNTTLTPASLTNVSLTGLTARTTYYVRSRVNNAIGNGEWSSTVSLATVDIPDAPTVSFSSKTATQVTVTLADPTYTGGGIIAREVQRSSSPSFTSPTTDSASPYTFTGLTRATTYYFRGRVQSSTGWGPWSSTLAVTTDVELPSAPTGYAATDITATTAYSSMPAVADTGGVSLTNLRVQVNTSASESGATTVTVGSYQAPLMGGLTEGTTYYYRMAVANTGDGGGWGAWGSWVSFATKSDVPSPPQSLAAGSITDTTAELTWAAPADLNGATVLNYVLRVARNSSFSESLLSFTPSSAATSQALDGLLSGTTYYAQIWTSTNNGLGSYSSVISFSTTGSAPTSQPLWMRLAGVWKSGVGWLKIAGVWKQGIIWQKVSGVWRKF